MIPASGVAVAFILEAVFIHSSFEVVSAQRTAPHDLTRTGQNELIERAKVSLSEVNMIFWNRFLFG